VSPSKIFAKEIRRHDLIILLTIQLYFTLFRIHIIFTMPPLSFEDTAMDQEVTFQTGTSSCHDVSFADNKIPQQQPRRRVVSFYLKVKVHPSIHHRDYSDEEYKNCWLTPFELTEIRHQSKRDIWTFQNSRPARIHKDPEFCIRGLENRLPMERLKRRSKKDKITSAVLSEQELQRFEKVFDPLILAQGYSVLSEECVREAQARAVVDEAAAQMIHNEPADASRNNLRRMRGLFFYNS
jgi:hypothetical protein